MGLLSILGLCPDGAGDGYDVCEEHGHDLREPEFECIGTKGHTALLNTERVPGFGYPKAIYEIQKVFKRHCRDCPEEREVRERIDLVFVFDDPDGGVKCLREYEVEDLREDIEDDDGDESDDD